MLFVQMLSKTVCCVSSIMQFFPVLDADCALPFHSCPSTQLKIKVMSISPLLRTCIFPPFSTNSNQLIVVSTDQGAHLVICSHCISKRLETFTLELCSAVRNIHVSVFSTLYLLCYSGQQKISWLKKINENLNQVLSLQDQWGASFTPFLCFVFNLNFLMFANKQGSCPQSWNNS